MSDSHDELNRQLTSLESDTESARMPGAAAARRRGVRRTRNQVSGSVFGAAAIAAGFVFAVGVNTQGSTPTPQPAGTPTSNATAAPPETLLTEDELPGPDGVAWQQTDGPATSFDCAPAPVDANTTETHYVTDDGTQFHQFVESSSDAERRIEQLRTSTERCASELVGEDENLGLIETWQVDGLGGDAWMAAYFAPMTEPDEFVDTNAVQVRLVRSGDYVSVVVHGGPSQGFVEAMDVQPSTDAATRLCEATGDDCDADPEAERLFPEPVDQLDPWLTVDDVAETTGMEEISEGLKVQTADGWNMAGLPSDPVEAGADSVNVRKYVDPQDRTGASVDETIARFPDEATAQAHYDEVVNAADSFEQEGTVVERVGTVDGDGYTGVAWRSDDTEFGTEFVYGVVTNGDAVAAVTHTQVQDHEVTGEQISDLLDRAGQRLGE